MSRGKFITLEGMDGAGKTTHLEWLRAKLQDRGLALTVTREPGGTPLGEALRKLLLDSHDPRHPDTEALLMFAARREHIAHVIEPALAAGHCVLCDRFTDAFFNYQLYQFCDWFDPGSQPFPRVSPQLQSNRYKR